MMAPALPFVLAALLASQPEDLVLCTSESDCPGGAFCEDGVCVMGEAPPPKRERRRRRAPRKRREGECRRSYDCAPGQDCFKRECGPEIPSRGTGLLVGGGIATGVGALFSIAAPLCKIDNPDNPRTQRDENVCLAVDLSFAIVALGIGVPLLIVGVMKRSEFKEWVKEYHPRLALAASEEKTLATIGFDF